MPVLGAEREEGQQSTSAEHSDQTAAPSSISGRDHMWNFVQQMTALLPAVIVPNQNLREACPVDRGNSSSDKEGSVTLAGLAALLEEQAREKVGSNEHKTMSEATLLSIGKRFAYLEELSNREKDKLHKKKTNSNNEESSSIVLGSAGSASPEVAAQTRHAAPAGSRRTEDGPPQGFVSVSELIPLFESLRRLHDEVDGMVQNLESRITSKVGHQLLKPSVNCEVDGDASFSGTRSDRDSHSSLPLNRENPFLANAAHAQPLRPSASGHHSAGSSQMGGQGDSDANTQLQLLKRKLRNQKIRMRAQARKRAAKAEQTKKERGANKGAPANP